MIRRGGRLRVENLRAGYGGMSVLWDVSLEVAPGETVALVGNNGAGKSTLLGVLSGIVERHGGRALYGEHDLAALRPDEIVRLGVAQVPQGRRLFGELSVRENLLMGAYVRSDGAIASDLARCFELFPRLHERREVPAGRLSGGEQQQVAIARALMARPALLLIDEMSLGLAPVLVDRLLEILARVRDEGVAILMVEQDVATALEFAERAYVLETGRVVRCGSARELLDDPSIKQAYLGV